MMTELDWWLVFWSIFDGFIFGFLIGGVVFISLYKRIGKK
jgi:hypothetical protein